MSENVSRTIEDSLSEIWPLLTERDIELDVVFDRILGEAQQLIGAEQGQLLLVRSDHMTIHATTGVEKLGAWVSLTKSFCGKFVVRPRKAHIAADLREPQYRDVYQDFLGKRGSPMLSELAVPVFVGADVVAVLNFESPKVDAFNVEHQQLIQLFAKHAALAFARLTDASELKRLRSLQIAEREIQESLAADPFKPDEVYDSILRQSLELLQQSRERVGGADDRGQLLLVHPDVLTIHATTGNERRGTKVQLESSFVGRMVLDKKHHAISRDLRKERHYIRFFGDDSQPMLSEVAVAVCHGTEVVGIINVESPKAGAFDESDVNTLSALANHAAIALTRAAAQEFREELNDIAAELSNANAPLDELLHRVVARGLDHLNAVSGGYLEVQGDRLQVKVTAGRKPPPETNQLTLYNCVTGKVARTKKPLRIDEESPEWKELYQGSTQESKSELAVPVLKFGTAFGVLNMESNRVAAFSERHENMLCSLAHLIGLAAHLRQVEENQMSVFHAMKNRVDLIVNSAKYVKQAIQNGTTPEPIHVTSIVQAGTHLRDVVFRAGERPNLRPLSLTNVVREFLHKYTIDDSIRVSLGDMNDRVSIVAADRVFLLKTLSLIVDNAREAHKINETADPRIDLAIEEDTEEVKITVADNGPGIPPERLARIFSGLTDERRVPGSGIGLLDARNMMNKMLGRINVEWTEVGAGTRFALTLKKTAMVAIVAGSLTTVDITQPPLCYFFSSDAQLAASGRDVLSRHDQLNDVKVIQGYTLQADDLPEFERQHSIVLIDLLSDPRAGLSLFEKIEFYYRTKQQPPSNPISDTHGLYFFWDLPRSSDELIEVLATVLDEAPKGRL